jgi:hypothetical protein
MEDLSGVQNEIIDLPEPPPINRTIIFQEKSYETLRKEFQKAKLALRFKQSILAMNSQDRYFILIKMLELLNTMERDSDIITLNWFQQLVLLNSGDSLTDTSFAWDTLYTTVCHTKAFKKISKLLWLDSEN